jgi:predicted transcriptional regulator
MPPDPKPAIHIDEALIKKLSELAESEGRSLESLIEEALIDLLQKRPLEQMRPRIGAAYQASLDQFDPLYKKLAEQD